MPRVRAFRTMRPELLGLAEREFPLRSASRRTLLVGAAIAVAVVPALADEQGAPPEMQGRFGLSPFQCQSYHRKTEGFTIISRDEYSWCNGPGCAARVESHVRRGDHLALKLSNAANPGGFTWTFRMLNPNTFERLDDGRVKEKLLRCGQDDAVAGIGLPTFETQVTPFLGVGFAGAYVEAVSGLCPELAVNRHAAAALIDQGRAQWVRFLAMDGKAADSKLISLDVARFSETAAEAARADAAEIRGFCEHVPRAFGDEGWVVPRVVRDPRR